METLLWVLIGKIVFVTGLLIYFLRHYQNKIRSKDIASEYHRATINDLKNAITHYQEIIQKDLIKRNKAIFKPTIEGDAEAIRLLGRLSEKIDLLRGEMNRDSPEDGHVISVTGGDPCRGQYTRTKRIYDWNIKNVRTIAEEDRPMTEEEFKERKVGISTSDLLNETHDKNKRYRVRHYHNADTLYELSDIIIQDPCMNEVWKTIDADTLNKLRDNIIRVLKEYSEAEIQQGFELIPNIDLVFLGVLDSDQTKGKGIKTVVIDNEIVYPVTSENKSDKECDYDMSKKTFDFSPQIQTPKGKMHTAWKCCMQDGVCINCGKTVEEEAKMSRLQHDLYCVNPEQYKEVVYTHPACVHNYCPHPITCKNLNGKNGNGCVNKRMPKAPDSQPKRGFN